MLKSMTAYGSAEYLTDNLEILVELRSVNYRYRDIMIRLPQSLQLFEEKIRAIISLRVKRGKIDVSIQIKNNGDEGVQLELNRPMVKAYIKVIKELNEELECEQHIDPSFFSQLKDIIITKPLSIDIERLWPDLEDVIHKAVHSMESMRIEEGRALEKDFLERLDRIKRYIDEIRNRTTVIVESYRDRLRQRINKLIEPFEINEDRLMQEVALMVDRSDITEELVRVGSHLEQFRNFMDRDDVIGRRLEFLLQEINREVNTMGSKAADSLVSQHAVEIKSELEKLREQIQNVE